MSNLAHSLGSTLGALFHSAATLNINNMNTPRSLAESRHGGSGR